MSAPDDPPGIGPVAHAPHALRGQGRLLEYALTGAACAGILAICVATLPVGGFVLAGVVTFGWLIRRATRR